jgi:hypothetical protein
LQVKKKADIADNIANFLNESFNAVSNAYKVTEDREWLCEQSAAELATFIGVTSDKIFRVLEAIENTNQYANEELELPSRTP